MSAVVGPQSAGSSDAVPPQATAANSPALAKTYERKKQVFFIELGLAGIILAALLVLSPKMRTILVETLTNPGFRATVVLPEDSSHTL